MRRLRGRRLHPELWMLEDCDHYGCSSPPSPPVAQPAPAPVPAPAPQIICLCVSPEPCPSDGAPSPSPVPVAGGGRREQGRSRGYGSPPGGGGGGDHHSRLVMSALIAVAAIAFVSLILLGVSVVVRRRRRQALLAAPVAAAPAAPTDADDDPEGGGGGVVHHVWHIRTVGLDEAAIDSIAATRYRAGAGLLGAADCTVCLGEFQDGELVRLLPKCGHAFHGPCIDTWLRAHVNCPLCRSDVLDPAVTTETGGGGESSSTPPADPVEDDDVAAAQADATSEAVAELEQVESEHQEASLAEEEQREQSSLPEPLPQPPSSLPHNVRRAASMDAAIVSTAVLQRLPEAAPEEEQSDRPKHAAGPPCAKASGSVGIPRLFFARHCRARSSVLPL